MSERPEWQKVPLVLKLVWQIQMRFGVNYAHRWKKIPQTTERELTGHYLAELAVCFERTCSKKGDFTWNSPVSTVWSRASRQLITEKMQNKTDWPLSRIVQASKWPSGWTRFLLFFCGRCQSANTLKLKQHGRSWVTGLWFDSATAQTHRELCRRLWMHWTSRLQTLSCSQSRATAAVSATK